MGYFPLDINLSGVGVLVAGGGQVGERKIKKLIKAGAKVRLVSLDLTPELERLAAEGLLSCEPTLKPELLDDVLLVVAATNDESLNTKLAGWANERRLLVNVADKPDLGNTIFPAVVERGDFRLAISTGGASPALSAKAKKFFEAELGPEYGFMTTLMAKLRPLVLERGATQAENSTIFKKVVNCEELWNLLARADLEKAGYLVKNLIKPLNPGEDFEFW